MTSFEIIGNGISLDVANGSKLTTEFVATTFNDNSIFSGSYTYPLTFPFTAKNVDYFEHSHHLENRSARKSREVIIVLFGMSWKKAKLEYSVKGDGYEGVLTVDNGAIANWMRDTKIGEVFTSNTEGKLTYRSISLGSTVGAAIDNILFSNYLSNSYGYRWPVVVNPIATGEEVELPGELANINDFNNLTVIHDDRLYCPMIHLDWLIKEICSWLGYKAQGSYLDDEFIKSLLIYNTGMRTGADWKSIRKINIAQHLPDISVSDFIKAIRNDHRVMIYFDSMTGIVHFEKSSQVLNSNETEDLRSAIHSGSIEIEPMVENAYKMINPVDDGDELYQTVPYEKSVLLGYDLTDWKEVPMTFGKPYMQTSTFKTIPNVTTPYARQTANIYSDSYSDNEMVYNSGNVYNMNPFSCRLLSFKGVVVVRESPNYRIPFATSDKKGNLGAQYTYSLEQGGSGGLLNNFSMSFYRFYCLTEQVKFKCEVSISQFFNLNPLQKIMLMDRNKGNVEAVIDKITFEPRSVGHGITAKVSCYPNYILNAGSRDLQVLVGKAEIENQNGTIYVKLFAKTSSTDRGEGVQFKRYYAVWLEFYSDPSGLIPKDVNSLALTLKTAKTDWRNNSDIKNVSTEDIIANGVQYALGERLAEEWRNSGNSVITEQYWFMINAINDNVNVIGNYHWSNGSWGKYEDIY